MATIPSKAFAALIQKHPDAEMTLHLETSLAHLTQDERDSRIQEFLKFIYLQSMQDSGFIPVTDDIDFIWHEYILQTRKYEALCKDLPGNKFVHHQTASLTDYATTRNRSEVVKSMLDWIPNYIQYFGEFTEKTAHYWIIVDFLSIELGLTLDQINQIGRSKSA